VPLCSGLVAAAASPPLAVSYAAELSWSLIALAGSTRPSFQTASQRGASSQRSKCQDACHGGCRRSASTIRCPSVPSGVQPVRCPARPVSSPSGVRRLLSGPLVSAVRRPAVWCLPACPVASVSSRISPAVALGTTSVRRATFTAGTGRGSCGLLRPGRLGQRLEEAWAQATLRRSSVDQVDQEEVSVAAGRWCSGGGVGGARPRTDQGGQTAATGALGWRLRQARERVEARRSCTCRVGRRLWAGCATTVRGCSGAWRIERTGPDGR
jgi:hypothetical protein